MDINALCCDKRITLVGLPVSEAAAGLDANKIQKEHPQKITCVYCVTNLQDAQPKREIKTVKSRQINCLK